MGRDKKASKPVIAVSTYTKKEEVEVSNKCGKVTTKPRMIYEYSNSMNGCDRRDQMISYYNIFNKKTVKWWNRMFAWCFELTQVNSFILYCLTRDEGTRLVPLLEFKKILEAEKNISPGHKLHVITKPNDSVVKMSQHAHVVAWSAADRNCAVCSTPGDRKRTKFKCNTCY